MLEPDQSVQDVIDLHTVDCDERQRFNFLDSVRDEAYRDWANCHDLDATRINRIGGIDNWPLEISGDAIATYKERHP